MSGSSAASFSQSVWHDTGDEPVIPVAHMAGNKEADIAIVGGGFTGCSAALLLAEQGLSVVVLEAEEIGFGASGRNGGQVIPGAKYDPSELASQFGERRGNLIADAVGGAADVVFELIERHNIRCSPRRSGWIQAAHSPIALKRVLQRAREWQQRGANVELLDAATLTERTGVKGYYGGWRDARAGTIHPLSYVRGLARAAIKAGAEVFQESPVQSLAREGKGWIVATDSGQVRARMVIVATDAYSDQSLLPALSRSLLLVQSAQIATEPLSKDLRERILPGGECMSETRQLAFYFRLSPDGRLMFGGRGAMGSELSERLFDGLHIAMKRMIPEAADHKVTHRWSGQVGLTLDGIPHLHQPEPGLFIGAGFNGRGIALATVMGQWLARWAHEGIEPPLPTTQLTPLRWHAVRKPIIAAGIAWAWTRDRMGLGA
jgi:sarcosine oxidase